MLGSRCGASHSLDKRPDVAEPRERMSKGIGDFPFEQHLDAQRQNVQQAHAVRTRPLSAA